MGVTSRAPNPRGWRGWWTQAAEALAGIILPANCRLCESPLLSASRIPICEGCLGSFPAIGNDICRRCGLPMDSFEAKAEEDAGQPELFDPQMCAACRLETYHFDRARSIFRYQGGLVRAIVLLKFEDMEPLADWFAERMAETARRAGLTEVDVVVPVPLHAARRRERGFNQAELLSKRVAKRLKIEHRGVLLVRKRPRPGKHLLTVRERWETVRGAFATQPGSQIDNQRVLLVDDVMTTGATLDSCSKALREAGAAEVVCLTAARAVVRKLRKVAS